MKRRLAALATGGAVVAAAALPAVAAPHAAGEHQSAGGGCARAAAAKEWRGDFSLTFAASATGTAPGEGGTHTITLDRSASSVPLRLRRTVVGRLSPVTTVVLATDTVVRGGSVDVQDSFETSRDGLVGALAGTHRPTAVTALLGLVPRTCSYKLQVSVSGRGAFTGEPSLEPGTTFTAEARSNLEHIPPSWKLGGHTDILPAQQTGCAGADPVEALGDDGCYQFVGGWTNDFATLKSCGSVVAVGCGAPDAPMGKARFWWNLSPVFK